MIQCVYEVLITNSFVLHQEIITLVIKTGNVRYQIQEANMSERPKKQGPITYNTYLYLQFWNDFLTISAFADYHGLSDNDAREIVNTGRREWLDITE